MSHKADNEFLKRLWVMRFQKIREYEENIAWSYQEILDDCLISFGSDDKSVMILREMVHDKRTHKGLAIELIKICRSTHPEFGLGC